MQNMAGLLSLVTCEICIETFTESGEHKPLMMPCGHTYCDKCIRNLVSPKSCPACRAPLGVKPVSSLPHNYSVIALLDKVLEPPLPPPVLKRGVSSMSDEELESFIVARKEKVAQNKETAKALMVQKALLEEAREALVVHAADLQTQLDKEQSERAALEAKVQKVQAKEGLLITEMHDNTREEEKNRQQQAEIEAQIEILLNPNPHVFEQEAAVAVAASPQAPAPAARLEKYPTPKQDVEVPEGVAFSIYESAEEDLERLKAQCQKWAGNPAAIDGFVDGFGHTALLDSVVGGLEEVKVLLAAGADIERKDKDGRTSLHRAAFTGHPKIVKLLVDEGACLTVVDNQGYTPYQLAQFARKAECARLLSS